jgi:hypothetical protein
MLTQPLYKTCIGMVGISVFIGLEVLLNGWRIDRALDSVSQTDAWFNAYIAGIDRHLTVFKAHLMSSVPFPPLHDSNWTASDSSVSTSTTLSKACLLDREGIRIQKPRHPARLGMITKDSTGTLSRFSSPSSLFNEPSQSKALWVKSLMLVL